MKVLSDVLILVVAFACGIAFMGWLSSPVVGTAPAAPILVVGDNPESKFTVERFEGHSVTLITDKLTGCEYVSTNGISITPRMYSDGIQVCGQSTYPNGEHDAHIYP
jgi:hypothetical protein